MLWMERWIFQLYFWQPSMEKHEELNPMRVDNKSLYFIESRVYAFYQWVSTNHTADWTQTMVQQSWTIASTACQPLTMSLCAACCVQVTVENLVGSSHWIGQVSFPNKMDMPCQSEYYCIWLWTDGYVSEETHMICWYLSLSTVLRCIEALHCHKYIIHSQFSIITNHPISCHSISSIIISAWYPQYIRMLSSECVYIYIYTQSLT